MLHAEAGPHRGRVADRLAASFLLVLLAVGSLVLWIGVPLGVLRALAEVTESKANHFVAAVVAVPIAMILFGWGLMWINRLYLRVTLALPLDPEPDEDDEEEPRVLRGPLEPLLVGSLAVATVALFVWFFFFAKNPGGLV